MNPAPQNQRAICPSCLRASVACICQWIYRLQPKLEVIILQHPLEVREAKGSARLLHLSLANSQLHIGEVFPEAFLAPLLQQACLLYPADAQPGAAKQLAWDAPEQTQACSFTRLIVLDGTWRKSRKMLYANPALQTLPRLSLQNMPIGQYRIRKAHKPGQLSTLEAVCHALAMHEANPQKYLGLMQAFDGFMKQWESMAGDTRSLADSARKPPDC